MVSLWSHSYIVAYVARIQSDNKIGAEESTGVHVREVENMVKSFSENNNLLIYSQGKVMNLAMPPSMEDQ